MHKTFSSLSRTNLRIVRLSLNTYNFLGDRKQFNFFCATILGLKKQGRSGIHMLPCSSSIYNCNCWKSFLTSLWWAHSGLYQLCMTEIFSLFLTPISFYLILCKQNNIQSKTTLNSFLFNFWLCKNFVSILIQLDILTILKHSLSYTSISLYPLLIPPETQSKCNPLLKFWLGTKAIPL